MKIARIASAAVIAALALASVASCDRTAKVDTGAVPAVLPVQRDSVASVSGPGSIAIVLDAPVDTNTMLSKAIGEFVSESLGGTWEGSCTDFDGMLNHYVAALASTYTEMFSEGLDDSDCLDNTSIVKYAENENYVSYFITHDLYLGGAHGSQMYSGATFRKADGRRIGWDVFTGKYLFSTSSRVRPRVHGRRRDVRLQRVRACRLRLRPPFVHPALFADRRLHDGDRQEAAVSPAC